MGDSDHDTNLTLSPAQTAELRRFLERMAARLTNAEGAVTMAVKLARENRDESFNLMSMLLSHDHCELCGATVWGNEHSCQQ